MSNASVRRLTAWHAPQTIAPTARPDAREKMRAMSELRL